MFYIIIKQLLFLNRLQLINLMVYQNSSWRDMDSIPHLGIFSGIRLHNHIHLYEYNLLRGCIFFNVFFKENQNNLLQLIKKVPFFRDNSHGVAGDRTQDHSRLSGIALQPPLYMSASFYFSF